jgi:hypothetical protein
MARSGRLHQPFEIGQPDLSPAFSCGRLPGAGSATVPPGLSTPAPRASHDGGIRNPVARATKVIPPTAPLSPPISVVAARQGRSQGSVLRPAESNVHFHREVNAIVGGLVKGYVNKIRRRPSHYAGVTARTPLIYTAPLATSASNWGAARRRNVFSAMSSVFQITGYSGDRDQAIRRIAISHSTDRDRSSECSDVCDCPLRLLRLVRNQDPIGLDQALPAQAVKHVGGVEAPLTHPRISAGRA